MSESKEPELNLEEICHELFKTVEIKDRSYHLKKYKNCCLGTEIIDQMLLMSYVKTREDGEILGQELLESGLLYHVTKDEAFQDKKFFYRFTASDDNGSIGTNESGSKISWSQKVTGMLPSLGIDGNDAQNTDYRLNEQKSDDNMTSEGNSGLLNEIEMFPMDEHNIKLLDNVHPASWVNPKEQGKYTMVVVGAGAGGLISAASAAGIGAKTAIIEQHLMGGDCLNIGCVPSKAMIRAARAVKDVQNCSEFGIEIDGNVNVNFGRAMERLRRLRADISHNDSAVRFSRDLGVKVYQGRAKFIGPNEVEVGGQRLQFQKAVIATGGSAALPPIDGLNESGFPYLTNARVFNLTELPKRMCVIGAGPIGLEIAQSMARFGSNVTCLVRGDKLLPKEDRDAAKIVHSSLEDDGVEFSFNTSTIRVENLSSKAGDNFNMYKEPFPLIRLHIMVEGEEKTIECESLLIATGRKPNVEGLGLKEANVEFHKNRGVSINQYLQTTNKNIYAVGDVCTRFQFTHVADFMARAVVRNALFFGRAKHSALLIPWATYTEPEVAHVGLYEHDLQSKKIKFDTYTKHFADVDRAICDGDTSGFVKIHCVAGSDEILGATIVNPNAGNMISEITVAMQMKIGLGQLANVIHPYPTQAEAIRMCGDMYNRTRLTPVVKGLLSRIANL